MASGSEHEYGQFGNTNHQHSNSENAGNTHQPWCRRYLGLSGRETIAGAAVTTGTAVGAPAAATGILGILGFSSGGVVGGSIAAGIQASIGNVLHGSLFAWLQSIAATGGFAILGPVGIGVAAVTGGGFYAWRRRRCY